MTLLQQLEESGRGQATPAAENLAKPGQQGDRWHGFAFAIQSLNLVLPQAQGVQTAPGVAAQPLPRSCEWVKGIISIDGAIDGAIYTVIDFAHFIGRRPVASDTRANLLLMSGKRFNSALLLDSRISLRSFRHDLPAAESTNTDPALAPFLRKSLRDGEQIWGVLDSAALMNTDRFIHIA